MTTAIVSAASLDFEIAQLQPRARAEAALDAVGHEPNPFRGSIARLDAVLDQREHVALLEQGQRLVEALAQRDRLLDERDRLVVEAQQLNVELRDIEQHPTIVRYREAPTVAIRFGVAHWFGDWKRWFESAHDRPLLMKQVAGEEWPAAILFDAADREVLHKWRSLEERLNLTSAGRAAAEEQLRALENAHHELGGL